jgi:hypothetical protein
MRHFLSTKAVADRLGLARQTIYRDRKREKPRYPISTATLDGAPIYDVEVVDAWEAEWDQRHGNGESRESGA